MTEDNAKSNRIPRNYRTFILISSPNAEDHGYDKEEVLYLLNLIKSEPDNPVLQDADTQNDIGTFFEDGVCVEKDIDLAKFWYEQAIDNGNDLARSNLADIYRKGTGGTPKDLKRAFELYKACGLPYAHYRCGEFYENGWGTEVNIAEAKRYYSLAVAEGHPLALKRMRKGL